MTVRYKGVQGYDCKVQGGTRIRLSGTRGYKGYKGVQGTPYFKRHSRYPAKSSKVCKRFPSSSL